VQERMAYRLGGTSPQGSVNGSARISVGESFEESILPY
jgi:hypothetical protein